MSRPEPKKPPIPQGIARLSRFIRTQPVLKDLPWADARWIVGASPKELPLFH
jgi:hypothetical protein